MASLFQAALTTTIRAYVCASTPDLATLSIRLVNEASTTATFLVDSFPSFAYKLRLALSGLATVAQRLEHCTAHSIRFNGTVVYRSMLLAATSYTERTDEETHALLLELEATCGREFLTAKFNNFSRAAPRSTMPRPRCGPVP